MAVFMLLILICASVSDSLGNVNTLQKLYDEMHSLRDRVQNLENVLARERVNNIELRKMLNEKDRVLIERVSNLEQSLAEEKQNNVELRNILIEKDRVLSERVSNLEKSLAEENRSNIELRKCVDRQNKSNKQTTNAINTGNSATQSDSHSTPETEKADRDSVITKRLLLQPTESEGTVAFYAYMSHDKVNPGTNHILIYDVVKTNARNGYHPASGVFIAPSDGYYVFTWSIRQYSDNHHSTELIVNNVVYGSQYIFTKSGIADTSVNQVIVAYVKQGEDVFIRTHATLSTQGDIRSDSNGRSSFAGWKLN